MKTGKFIVSDPIAFGQEPFLSVENASFRLAVLPLLEQKVEVSEILLEGVRLKLAETATGQKNWELGKAGGGVAKEEGEESVVPLSDVSADVPLESTSKRMDLSIAALSCKDTEIIYRNMAEGLSYRVVIDSLEVADVRPGRQMPVSVSGMAFDERSTVKAAFTLHAVAQLSPTGDVSGQVNELDIRLEKGASAFAAAVSAKYGFSSAAKTLSLDALKGQVQETPFSGILY